MSSSHPLRNDHLIPPPEVMHPGAMVRMMGDQLGMGYWRFVVRSNEMYWSERVYEIYGLPLQEGPIDLNAALAVVVAPDRVAVAEFFKSALVHKRARKIVFRADTTSGIKVIETLADVVFGLGGEVIEIIGTTLDITGRSLKDASAVGRSLLVRALMKNVPAAIAVFDTQMNYLAVSDFWVSGHYAKSARDLVGKNHYELRPDLSAEHKEEHRRVLAGETVRSPRSYTKDRFGNPIHQICTMCPWHTVEGKIGGLIMMLGVVDEETAPKGKAATPALPTKRELLDILKDFT